MTAQHPDNVGRQAQAVAATAGRPDASMSLLRELADGSVDPDYARVSQQSASGARTPRRRRSLLVLTMVVAGVMFGMAAIGNIRSAPAQLSERRSLIAELKEHQQENQQLQGQAAGLESEITGLQESALTGDPQTQKQLTELGAQTGAAAVTGPGIVVVVDDAPSLNQTGSAVVDQDLRQLVNGLWTAGAEAIAINGHRLSTRTAIRNAGSAITVDYVSLNAPYTVEAIGDPARLPARLAESPGGQWWSALRSNFGMRYDVSQSQSLTLGADPGLNLRHAEKPR